MNAVMASHAVAPRQWVPPQCGAYMETRQEFVGANSMAGGECGIEEPQALWSGLQAAMASPGGIAAWSQGTASARGVEPRRQVQHRHRSRSLLAALHRSATPRAAAGGESRDGGRGGRNAAVETRELGRDLRAVEAPSTPNRLASRLGVLILTAAAAAAAGAGMSAQAVQAEAVQAEAVQAEALQAPTAATPTGAPVPSAALAVPEADCQAAAALQLPPVAAVAAVAVPTVGPIGSSRSPRQQTAQQHVAALEGRVARMMAWVRQGRRGHAGGTAGTGREGQAATAQQAELRRRVAGVVEGRRATSGKQQGEGEGERGLGAVSVEEVGRGVGGAGFQEMGGEDVRRSGHVDWLKGIAGQYGMALPSPAGARGGAAVAAEAESAAAASAVVAGRVLAALRGAEHLAGAAQERATAPGSLPPAAAAAKTRLQAPEQQLSRLEQKLRDAEASRDRYEAAVQWTEGRLAALASLALTVGSAPSPALAASRSHLLSSLAFAQKRAHEEEQRVNQLRQQLATTCNLPHSASSPSSSSPSSSPPSTALPPFQSAITPPAPPAFLLAPSTAPLSTPPSTSSPPSASSHPSKPAPPRSHSLPSRPLAHTSWHPTEAAAHATSTTLTSSLSPASSLAAMSILQQAPVLVEGVRVGEWAREYVAESVAQELSKRRTGHGGGN
ncbi:hypothetical protein CLOP_g22071 [Closterium sp. NIES-67]|nr:hypothetical protein CLOP_g22071 [Closterium sp. NIES-67]